MSSDSSYPTIIDWDAWWKKADNYVEASIYRWEAERDQLKIEEARLDGLKSIIVRERFVGIVPEDAEVKLSLYRGSSPLLNIGLNGVHFFLYVPNPEGYDSSPTTKIKLEKKYAPLNDQNQIQCVYCGAIGSHICLDGCAR